MNSKLKALSVWFALMLLCAACRMVWGQSAQPQADEKKVSEKPSGGTPSLDEEKTARAKELIAKLGDDAFEVRDEATRDLIALGRPVLGLVKEAMLSTEDIEVKMRAEKITNEIVRMTALEDIEIRIETDKPKYRVGDEPRVTVRVTNNTGRSIVLHTAVLENKTVLMDGDSKQLGVCNCERAVPQIRGPDCELHVDSYYGYFTELKDEQVLTLRYIAARRLGRAMKGDPITHESLLKCAGKCTIAVTYSFDRDAYVARCGKNCPCHDDPLSPWNRTVVGKKTVEVSFEVEDEQVLVYPEGTRTSQKWINLNKDGGGKVAVDVGLTGHGIEAYLSLTGEVVVVDSEKNETLWSTMDASWCDRLSFARASRETDGAELVLLKLANAEGCVRFYELTTGKEKYVKAGAGGKLVACDQPPADDGKAVALVRQISGDNAECREAKYFRILSDKEWKEVWKLTGRRSSRPLMDFSKNMVIAVFRGARCNSSGYSIQKAIDNGGVITLFGDDLSYQTCGPGGGGHAVTPYGLVVIPRSRGKIELKNNVQNFIGGPPVWKTMAEFEELSGEDFSNTAAKPGAELLEKIAKLVADLGSEDFEAREAATKALIDIGESAINALEEAKSSPDEEVRSRAKRILEGE